MNRPRHALQFDLPFKAVHIQCLDAEQRTLRNASGLIVRESAGLFLYTSWHVVTGYDMHDVRVGHTLPDRRFLRVIMQDAQQRAPTVQAIGGNQSFVLSLYESRDKRSLPLWWQDQCAVPQPELNAIGLRVPFWHDAVKLPLPDGVRCSELQQVLPDPSVAQQGALPGDTVYIVGYPYGYSVLGSSQPTPVVVTRHVAALRIENRQREILLDGPGARGMSGGPVFIDRGAKLPLLGLYTGLIYPDHLQPQRNPTTALGTMCDLTLSWNEQLALKPYERT